MVIDFQATMTEADFKRPLLDAAEERLAREARGDVDLTVEGLDRLAAEPAAAARLRRGPRAELD